MDELEVRVRELRDLLYAGRNVDFNFTILCELMRPKNGAHPMNWTPLVLLFFLAAACFTAVTVYRIEKDSDR